MNTDKDTPLNYYPMASEFRRLAVIPFRALEKEFLRGQTPDPDDLAGWEFRGLNRPALTRAFGIRKFVKGFYKKDHEFWGYNCPAVQNIDELEWQTKPNNHTPKQFGFYQVSLVDATSTDNHYLHALLLNYGKGGNHKLNPCSGLRDYLVQVADHVLLGVAFLAIGRSRLKLPSYFLLSRFRRGRALRDGPI